MIFVAPDGERAATCHLVQIQVERLHPWQGINSYRRIADIREGNLENKIYFDGTGPLQVDLIVALFILENRKRNFHRQTNRNGVNGKIIKA